MDGQGGSYYCIGNGYQKVVDAHGGICKSGTWCVEGRQQRVHAFILSCSELNTGFDGVQVYSGKSRQDTVQWFASYSITLGISLVADEFELLWMPTKRRDFL